MVSVRSAMLGTPAVAIHTGWLEGRRCDLCLPQRQQCAAALVARQMGNGEQLAALHPGVGECFGSGAAAGGDDGETLGAGSGVASCRGCSYAGMVRSGGDGVMKLGGGAFQLS